MSAVDNAERVMTILERCAGKGFSVSEVLKGFSHTWITAATIAGCISKNNPRDREYTWVGRVDPTVLSEIRSYAATHGAKRARESYLTMVPVIKDDTSKDTVKDAPVFKDDTVEDTNSKPITEDAEVSDKSSIADVSTTPNNQVSAPSIISHFTDAELYAELLWRQTVRMNKIIDLEYEIELTRTTLEKENKEIRGELEAIVELVSSELSSMRSSVNNAVQEALSCTGPVKPLETSSIGSLPNMFNGKRTSVTIVGLLDGQAKLVSGKVDELYPGRYNLKFVINDGHSMSTDFPSSDAFIILTKFISHSHYEAVRATGKPIVYSTGINDVVKKLNPDTFNY